MADRPLRIAMWSGPRNLSTAMMYAFAQRRDCAVTDEPFYAAYLALTGARHPMREAVLASQPTDPAEVVAGITGPVPGGRPVWYQKHMAHHMVAGIPTDWMAGMTNVFLIRHPARVVASYAAKRENPALEDLGFVQQFSLYQGLKRAGSAPVVVDSHDVRNRPGPMLEALCRALGIAFDPAMLSWPPGPRPYDGVWAAHWYGAVHRSTGFAPESDDLPALEGAYAALVEEAMPIYETLRAERLRP